MTAYAIGQLTIHHTDWQEEYAAKIGPLVRKHGGRFLAKGAPSQLEGQAQLPTILLAIEFPDIAAAENWYQDPENQALVQLRQTGSDLELQLVEGL